MAEGLDQLVRLYDLPSLDDREAPLRRLGVTVRRPRAYERHLVCGWVEQNFQSGWRSECEVAFSRLPVTCFIASSHGDVVGFCCYEVTCLNFVGPIGVAEQFRGRGVGTSLLLHSLSALAQMGYAYAIIGAPIMAAGFYSHVVGAIDIPGSGIGIYVDPLSRPDR